MPLGTQARETTVADSDVMDQLGELRNDVQTLIQCLEMMLRMQETHGNMLSRIEAEITREPEGPSKLEQLLTDLVAIAEHQTVTLGQVLAAVSHRV